MGYTNKAYAVLRNDCEIPLAKVTLYHQYSDDPEESLSASDIAVGEKTPKLTANYNTGFIRTGQDYWWATCVLADGSTWTAPTKLQDTLHREDDGTTKTFVLTGSIFSTFSGKTLRLVHKRSEEYNSWAAVQLRNDLPVGVSPKLEHKYSTYETFDRSWSPVDPGATTPVGEVFIAYYNSGFIRTGDDYWNVSAIIDVGPYDDQPDRAWKPIRNDTTDLACMLAASDNGKLHTVKVDGTGINLEIASGGKLDQWKTWNGYNTIAFLRIRNDFATPLLTSVLSHRYSGDASHDQTRGLLAPGAVSDYLVAEYNTGPLRTGSDYWTMHVYLKDGTWYANAKADKGCMLRAEDAIKPGTFAVSAEVFTMDLASGACSDGMVNRGTFAPRMGRDVTQSYDRNAYVGSHNAYANLEAGFWYAQQTAGIKTQLGQGATTLLLDIFARNNEIVLLHEGLGWIQPFAPNQRLYDALVEIKMYLELKTQDPVTIIFEDRVEAEFQGLIREAFVTSGTWDLVFNPDTYGVDHRGWPTLADLYLIGKPLVVLTSNENSPDFAYQWRYMSENVWGGASLDRTTWLDPRPGSQPLDKLALCALNHFPDWTVEGFKLSPWLSQARVNNSATLLTAMLDACKQRWGRYPNYFNADFWEEPATDGMVSAITHLNRLLHPGRPGPILRVQHRHAILTDAGAAAPEPAPPGAAPVVDWSRGWDAASRWVEAHFDEICPPLDPTRSGPPHLQLFDAVNLTIVVGTLHSAPQADNAMVRQWSSRVVDRLVGYFAGIEPHLLGQLDELCAIPYLMLERVSPTRFELSRRALLRKPSALTGAAHDQVLLAALAGDTQAVTRLEELLAETRAGGPGTTSRAYDLTHEIIYLHHARRHSAADPALAADLAERLAVAMPANADLGAELLACYRLAGGADPDIVDAAVEQLVSAQPASDVDGPCDGCPAFKEQVHLRITAILGLGLTGRVEPALPPDQR